MIFFITGGSGTGKTVLSQAVAKKINGVHISIDTIRVALQNNNSSPAYIRALLNEKNYITKSQQELVAIHKKISDYVSLHLKKNYVSLFEKNQNEVIEGDDITPEFIFQLQIERKNIRTICLFEDSEQNVVNAISSRCDKLMQVDAQIAAQQLRHAFLNGQRIKKEATQFSIPLIKSSSFNTLTKRALKKLFE
jgi:2-phosphoglycerate kinase